MENNEVFLYNGEIELSASMPYIVWTLQSLGGERFLLPLDRTQHSLLANRAKRRFLVLCKEERITDLIDKAANCKQLEDIAKKYSVCDVPEFADLNCHALKKVLKVVVHVLYKYPKLRGQLCYIGSADSYSERFSRLSRGDMSVLSEFGIQYICDRDIASHLGGFVERIARDMICNMDGCWAMALHVYNLFNAMLFTDKEYEGYAYLKFVSDIRNAERTGFHPVGCNSSDSVTYHEIGHLIDYSIGLSKNPDFLRYYNSIPAYEKKRGLSEYALTNEAEFVAEAFAEAMCNPSPRPIARQVMFYIDSLYAKI